ncbi:MAG: hypothetical protein ABIO99_01975 [Candidatus Limnocylindria bacterium]
MSAGTRRVWLVVVAVLALSACAADESPSPTATPTSTPSPSLAPSATGTPSPEPTATPEPPLSLALPESTDQRVVSASVDAQVGADGGTFVVTVTSGATDRIDEIVLRWPTELNDVLFLAPFTPTEDRIRDGGPPLVQPWTKWIIGPGERGEPDGAVSLGWGPLLPGATLVIELDAARLAPEPIAFDLQILSNNDLLTLDGGDPAELRIEIP